MTKNVDIRMKAKESGVYLWQIAERLGICDNSFSRKLRKEMDEKQKKKIFAIIDDISSASVQGVQ